MTTCSVTNQPSQKLPISLKVISHRMESKSPSSMSFLPNYI